MTVEFAQKYGPWALVTGASRGLGAEFARQCAERGLNVVLVATNADRLAAQASAIEQAYPVETRTVPLDLAREDFLDEVRPVTDPLRIGLLINNAGISTVGPFLERDTDYLVRQLHVNSRAGLILAHHFGAGMALAGQGGIIFVSSGSALHGTPYAANYAGTKAYNLILAESLWYELGPLGVDVLGFMAGTTDTPGLAANHPKPSRVVPVMDPAATVTEALDALGRRPSRGAGRANRLGYTVMGLLPRSAAVRTLGRSMSAMFGPFGTRS